MLCVFVPMQMRRRRSRMKSLKIRRLFAQGKQCASRTNEEVRALDRRRVHGIRRHYTIIILITISIRRLCALGRVVLLLRLHSHTKHTHTRTRTHAAHWSAVRKGHDVLLQAVMQTDRCAAISDRDADDFALAASCNTHTCARVRANAGASMYHLPSVAKYVCDIRMYSHAVRANKFMCAGGEAVFFCEVHTSAFETYVTHWWSCFFLCK